MSYLLDAMIIGFFQRAGREKELVAAASSCPIAVVEEVAVELHNGRTFGGAKFRKWFDASKIQVRSIEVGSPASTTLTQLIGAISPARNLGERASIALASSESSLTLVTHDKAAMWLALREIWEPGERVLGVSVFLRRLFTSAAIEDPAVLDDVMAHVDKMHWPTWWPQWRASQKQAEHASSTTGAAGQAAASATATQRPRDEPA